MSGELADDPTEMLLGVEQSAMGYRWRLRQADDRQIQAIMQRSDVPEVLARLLVARGIGVDAVEDFLHPTLRNMLPDPAHLLDMQKAATRVADAIEAGETIGIFGDYDVDGATSTALLVRYLRAVGRQRVLTYIPDRLVEGYGPNSPALLAMQKQGASLVITVDCGAAAFEPLADAAAAGLDVVVIDHHIGDAALPKAVAVVNPNRVDEESPHGHLAAVGVSFLLVVAVNGELRRRGRTALPNPLQWLDMVALGTVCDVVPLRGVNRALVAQGLKVLAQRGNPGLAALTDVARMDEAPAAYHLGFLLGPRINAGGRVGKAGLGVELLTSDDYVAALEMAQQLDQYNNERKTLEMLALEEAIASAEARADDAVIVVDGEWHAGVIGIVAGRLKDRFHKPVAVVAREGSLGKASARSVSGVDFGAAVVAARHSGLLVAGGGHAMAAGFTVECDRLEELREFLNGRMAAGVLRYGEERSLTVDALLAPQAATPELLQCIKQAEPFGMGNPSPRFAFADMKLVKADRVGESHIRCVFTDGGVGGRAAGGRLQGIAFRAIGTPLEAALAEGVRGRKLHIAGQLRLNSWNGVDRVDVQVEDACVSG